MKAAKSSRHKEAITKTPAAAASDAETGGKPRTVWREYFESIVVTVVMALFFMTFVGQAAVVPSASMQNTILVGDRFLINKFIFAPGSPAPFLPQREVRRGDVIIFKYPGNREHPEQDTDPQVETYKTYFVKRVVGLPGDTVEVRGANVLINSQTLPEHRLTTAAERTPNAPLTIAHDPPRRSDEPYSVYYNPRTVALAPDNIYAPAFFHYGVGGQPAVVPPNHYFVMGDNRDDSTDSRAWGFVPRELVVGRALFVIWSYDESAPSRGFFPVDFFLNTRWRRTGTLIK